MFKTTAESGNVLFLILIAAALFAALSYVVVQSSRSNAGSLEHEKARLEAAKLMNFFVAISSRHKQDQVMRPNSLRIGAGGGYGLCTSSAACFWLNHPTLPKEITVLRKTYPLNVVGSNQNRGVVGIGPGLGDDMIWIRDLPADICAAINKGLGLPEILQNAGNFPAAPITLARPEYMGCTTNQDGTNIYYQVLREG